MFTAQSASDWQYTWSMEGGMVVSLKKLERGPFPSAANISSIPHNKHMYRTHY
jgi:hypothetical protein